MPPLLRELMLGLVKIPPPLNEEGGGEGRLVSVILDQLKMTSEVSVQLPKPHSDSLQQIASPCVLSQPPGRCFG